MACCADVVAARSANNRSAVVGTANILPILDSLRSLSQKMKKQALHVIEKQNGVDHVRAHLFFAVGVSSASARDLRYAATAQRAYSRQLQPTKQQ